MELLEALLLAACFAVIEIPVSSFQIPHFEVTIESLIHVLIRNDPRKENRIFYPLLYSENSFDFPSYLTASRPNILFNVCLCARFQSDPRESHLTAVKRIFRYLKVTTNLGLLYRKSLDYKLVGLCDADYAGDRI